MRSKRNQPLDLPDDDLTHLLSKWAYNEDNAIRRIVTEDGREVLQVRLPLGVEQYELHGRPDGKRPYKQESWLHVYRRRARQRGPGFILSDKDVERLYHEGMLYYYRYLRFFQMQNYRLCARDTRRNIKLLEFVGLFANEAQTEQLEQYRPYILRMHVMSRALWKLQKDNNVRSALRTLEKGAQTIEDLPTLEDNQIFEFEKVRSLQSLADLHGQLSKHLPVPKDVQLEKEMEEAVAEENYERAAILRDEILAFREDQLQKRSTSRKKQ